MEVLSMKKNRRSTKRHFSDEVGTTQAVATANLVCLLDPDKVDSDGIETIAEATGSKEEFVENLVTLVEDANEASETIPEETIIENFSRKVRSLCENKRFKKNFSDEEQPTSDEVLADVAEIVGLVDDEAFDVCSTEEIAETIADATGADEEVVEAIVELAQNNFAAGKRFAMKSMRRIGRQKFARLRFSDSDVNPAQTAEEKPVKDETATNPVVDNRLPAEGSEGIEQNPINEEFDPTPDAPFSEAVDAGEAMAVQNELATVQGIEKVPEAESNFSRTRRVQVKDNFSVLKSLFGDKYIE
jgi:ribosomal protein L17